MRESLVRRLDRLNREILGEIVAFGLYSRRCVSLKLRRERIEDLLIEMDSRI